MSLITVISILIFVGILLWLINTYMPMAASIKRILNVVLAVAVTFWVLYAFGFLGHPIEIGLLDMK